MDQIQLQQRVWFKHFADTAESQIIVKLLIQLGWDAYGIYNGLLEKLRRTTSGSLPVDYDSLGWQLRYDSGKLKSIIEDYGLFVVRNGYFYAESLMEEMKHYERVSDAKRRAGIARASQRWQPNGSDKANDIPMPQHQGVAHATYPIADAKHTLPENMQDKDIDKDNTNPNTPLPGCGVKVSEFVNHFLATLEEPWLSIMSDWISYKRRERSMYKTEETLRRCYNQLLKLSANNAEFAREMVDSSIANGYKGIYPPRGRIGPQMSPNSIRPSDQKSVNDLWN